MKQPEIEQYLNSLLIKRKKGKGFSEIRKELTKKGVEDSSIKEILRQLGDLELKKEVKKSVNSKTLNSIMMGAFLFIFGSGITIYSYLNSDSQVILWYGAIVIGLAMIINGIIKYKKT